MITIGIDPGLDGAIAAINDGRGYAVVDMPVITKGTGTVKREINASALIEILRELAPAGYSVKVALERVNAMPGQGVSSVFSLGDSFGCIRACVAACRFELEYVTPVTWKKHFKLTSDKEVCRALAAKMFPQADLRFKKHADRAEALLMARWLYDRN